MAITVGWDDQSQAIARWTFTGKWTWDEFNDAQHAFAELLDGITYRIDLIADMSNSRTLPPNSLSAFRKRDASIHPLRDRVVMVGANAYIRSMAATFDRMFASKTPDFLFAHSLEEARELLR